MTHEGKQAALMIRKRWLTDSVNSLPERFGLFRAYRFPGFALTMASGLGCVALLHRPRPLMRVVSGFLISCLVGYRRKGQHISYGAVLLVPGNKEVDVLWYQSASVITVDSAQDGEYLIYHQKQISIPSSMS